MKRSEKLFIILNNSDWMLWVWLPIVKQNNNLKQQGKSKEYHNQPKLVAIVI